MEIRFRKAVADDLESLTEIYNQAIRKYACTADMDEFTPAQRQEWFEAHQGDKYVLLVVEADGAVKGYGTLSPYRPGRRALDHVAEVSYYLADDIKGHGIGDQLLSKLEASAKENGISVIIAILLRSNLPSVNLLKKHGFDQWGLLPGIVHQRDFTTDHVYYGKYE